MYVVIVNKCKTNALIGNLKSNSTGMRIDVNALLACEENEKLIYSMSILAKVGLVIFKKLTLLYEKEEEAFLVTMTDLFISFEHKYMHDDCSEFAE
ncbi:hypothetical protein T4D_16268 [Trichinella pseudospiralis]|uniref:Uncharacterized protein n=1 Tax=Trichinella pseudospiralis TaxID=6337 RepID=A0A0V1FCG7_TRIPS|nr:hypothetical protein T4D_16268 [Trichinella pseudospiralis]